MKEILLSIIKQLVFWMIVFAFTRAVFLIYYMNSISNENIRFTEALTSFWYALPLDLSAACYIILFPFVLLLVQSIVRQKWINYLNIAYTAIILFAYILITTTELGIYEEWKTKLHFKALKYMANPDEIYNSCSTKTFFILVALLIIQFYIGFYIYYKYIYKRIENQKRNWLFTLIFLIITPGLIFLGIRGGFKEIPINQSKPYYSKHNILNLASVNSGYNLLLSTIENFRFRKKNPFEFYEPEEAVKIVEKLHIVHKDTTISILKTKRPNIVLLLIESWSADVIESCGGEKGITPQFHELEKEGVLFTNLYATGNRSEQAMSSIFGGFPATPITAITHNLEKIIKLPSLIKLMKTQDYSTSFYFGGQLIYGGIKSYIMINEFDRIYEISDFDEGLPQGKLGIHDEYTLSKQLDDLNNENQPFFSVLFTVSSHSPYDQPMDDVIDWGGNEKDFLNSVYYTDRCLGDYFRKAKKQSWYKNTLFIIVADHSHNTYRNWPVYTKEYRKIPLLFYGEVIKEEFRGQKISRISSQNDITGTLLAQLDLKSDEFFWSRNLFNPYTPEFAYYEATEGVGWICQDGYFVYNKMLDSYLKLEVEPELQDSIIKDGKAYLQVVFQQFLDF